jgi:outer membrane receptor protein involved in Fe transport
MQTYSFSPLSHKGTLLFFFILFLNSLQAQKSVLTGKVMDALTGEPLIGATIKIKDTGTVTNENGNYTLLLDLVEQEILFSYLGYQTLKQKIRLGKNETRTLDIKLSAEDNLLNVVTVTSGKFEKPLGEVTVSMEVLKPKLIESTNSITADRALDRIPGVNIVGGQANIRGGAGFSYGAGSRVLILMDDIPMLQADAGSANWNDLPIENVEQIEVLKGAASALYGSSAMNGIVNLRTAYAKEKPETKAALYYTSYRNPTDTSKIWWGGKRPYSYGTTVSHKRKIGKLDLVLSGLTLETQSFNQNTFDKYSRIVIGTRYALTDRLSVGVNTNFNIGKSSSFFYWKDGGKGAFQATASTISETKKLRYTIDPFLTYFDKSGSRHKLLGRFYSVDNNANQNQSNHSQLSYGEYQFQHDFKQSDMVLTAGVVGMNTFVNAILYGDTTYTASNIAGYIQLDKKFFKKLSFSTGLRYEFNQIKSPSIVGGIAIPNGVAKESKPVFRVGLNYQAAPYTYFRTSIGQAYRFPTIAEKFIKTSIGAGGIKIIPNPNLTSETGWTAEVGVKQGFKLGDWKGIADLSAFWTEYQNMMEFTFVLQQFSFQSQNIGNTRIKGIEATVAGQGKISDVDVSLLAGYLYIDPKFKTFTPQDSASSTAGYNILKYRFKHSLKGDIELGYHQYSIGANFLYNSNMEAIDVIFNSFLPGVNAFRASHNKGYRVLDIRASYQASPSVRLSVIGANILNEEYTTRPGLLEAPRNITVRMDTKF